MGGLRPIGSEKLQGMDKIKRMIEISKYKESIPQRVNEDKKTLLVLPMVMIMKLLEKDKVML